MSPTGPSQRLRSLDVFRGMTIAAMIVANSPGNETSYAFLRHAAWHGWTPTDLIFPFFLFIVGVAIPLSFAGHLELGDPPSRLLSHALRRSAVLFMLGLPGGISLDPNGFFRVPGVLQRIGVCYCAASALFLKTKIRTQALIAAGILISYWIVMTQVPVPGHGKGDLSLEGNIASYLDRLLLGRHLNTDMHDPEGILSTFPALATTLLGLLAGHWLRSNRMEREKAAGLLGAGMLGIAAGQAWGLWFPINKQIWTSSFALFSGGCALCLLALCYWIIEIRALRLWGLPFEVLGDNAIAAYCLSSLAYALLELWRVPATAGAPNACRLLFCNRLFGGWLSPPAASLAYALGWALLWTLVMGVLYRKRVFIKI